MFLIPRSEGLSLITATLVVLECGVTTREGEDLEELDDEWAADEPAHVESAVEGRRVDDEEERCVRI